MIYGYFFSKALIMKTLNKILLLVILVFGSCNEDEKRGVCYACCNQSGNIVCKTDITEAECKTLNNQKTDGYSWSFSEGKVCPIPTPLEPK